MSDRLARNALYLTAASVGQKILSFVYFLLLARVLQPEKTGQYSIALALVTTFYVVSDLGIPSVIIREVARAPGQALPLVRRALAFKIPTTLLALLLANLTAWLLGYESAARWLVLFSGGTLALDSFSVFFYGVLRGKHVLAYESVGMFVGQAITLAFGAAVLFVHPSLPLLIVILILGSLFNFLFSAGQAIRRLGWAAARPAWSMAGFRQIFGLSLPFFLAAAFVKLFSTLDVQFLKFFWGNAAVGVYSVAYKFTYAFQFLPLAFVAALYPGMSALVGERDQAGLTDLFEQAVRYMLLLSVPLAFGLAFIAQEAVRLVGASYAAAVPVLSFLPFVLIPSFLDFPVGSLLNAAGRQNAQTALFGATLGVNFLLDLWLVPAYGMVGAAAGSIASVTLLALGGFLYVPRVIRGYRLRRLWRLALPVVAAGVAMRLAAHGLRVGLPSVLPSPHPALAVIVAGSVLVYVAALFATRALRRRDVAALARLVRRAPRAAEPAEVVEKWSGDAGER